MYWSCRKSIFFLELSCSPYPQPKKTWSWSSDPARQPPPNHSRRPKRSSSEMLEEYVLASRGSRGGVGGGGGRFAPRCIESRRVRGARRTMRISRINLRRVCGLAARAKAGFAAQAAQRARGVPVAVCKYNARTRG